MAAPMMFVVKTATGLETLHRSERCANANRRDDTAVKRIRKATAEKRDWSSTSIAVMCGRCLKSGRLD